MQAHDRPFKLTCEKHSHRGSAKIPGSRLVNVSVSQQNDKISVWAVARTPRPISPEQVARLNELANSVTGREVALTVRSVITAETTRDGNVYEPELPPDESQNGR